MTELFMKLLNMSVNAGWLVLAVLLVRIMFHKAPKWLFPLLWSFVWIRLLMPNALESRLSVIPDIAVPRIVELCVDSASHAKRIGKSLECHS